MKMISSSPFQDINNIKTMDKNELNSYGYFFDFIYYLISDEINLKKKN